ncbi:GntR family transcriptional regulator [Clostridium botulinum]|uniref:Transcriptional regulator, GntR family n=1 Tax=Clostridium botulinum (strain Okra / Type B1) TaxID=498213 RepID=B1ILI5_CLOBK|nr:GntR family transcriptional regulator [Clostridium botulinum]EKX78615.1 GntR family transcriptional regulator [Clostridium botulinum CFSAN001628]ACA46657.1 transcriptional regulator, GntR family [Clostridium botulinum B1 str. Okra]MBD5563059.1 GntR family transcriptional regulator [Clostridium botulinum]MBD5567640.1 GntR family transcriptional regulator [Clostridium botulinum]MBD5571859.1 GntR family transcriptional regulator [Clostridium botulinum]
MRILISNASEQPIYEQILCQIKAAIIQGELKEGEILPSIRNLAKEVGVSVITTKRAYEELEKEGFVETVKGKGTFVAAQNKELLREKKIKIIEEKLNEVIEDSKLLDISYEEILEILKILYFQ